MVARVATVAFQGIEGAPVDVQVMVGPGKLNMYVVGLPDKAVAESRERVQAALHASGLTLPPKKAIRRAGPWPRARAASDVRTLARVAADIPNSPARIEHVAPAT